MDSVIRDRPACVGERAGELDDKMGGTVCAPSSTLTRSRAKEVKHEERLSFLKAHHLATSGRLPHMTDEQTIKQLLEPSAVLSRALDFMETDLDADAYNVISAWVARAIREVSEDLARVSTQKG
jgi:hypothetical protein